MYLDGKKVQKEKYDFFFGRLWPICLENIINFNHFAKTKTKCGDVEKMKFFSL